MIYCEDCKYCDIIHSVKEEPDYYCNFWFQDTHPKNYCSMSDKRGVEK